MTKLEIFVCDGCGKEYREEGYYIYGDGKFSNANGPVKDFPKGDFCSRECLLKKFEEMV